MVYSGPQAQFLARGVAGQVEPAADLLAGHVEERRRGLQDRRLDAAESRRRENGRARARRHRAAIPPRSRRMRFAFTWLFLEFAASFNKAGAPTQPFSRFQGERRTHKPGLWTLRPQRGHGRMRWGGSRPNHYSRGVPWSSLAPCAFFGLRLLPLFSRPPPSRPTRRRARRSKRCAARSRKSRPR